MKNPLLKIVAYRRLAALTAQPITFHPWGAGTGRADLGRHRHVWVTDSHPDVCTEPVGSNSRNEALKRAKPCKNANLVKRIYSGIMFEQWSHVWGCPSTKLPAFRVQTGHFKFPWAVVAIGHTAFQTVSSICLTRVISLNTALLSIPWGFQESCRNQFVSNTPISQSITLEEQNTWI